MHVFFLLHAVNIKYILQVLFQRKIQPPRLVRSGLSLDCRIGPGVTNNGVTIEKKHILYFVVVHSLTDENVRVRISANCNSYVDRAIGPSPGSFKIDVFSPSVSHRHSQSFANSITCICCHTIFSLCALLKCVCIFVCPSQDAR